MAGQSEQISRKLLCDHQVNLAGLAPYMQILSTDSIGTIRTESSTFTIRSYRRS